MLFNMLVWTFAAAMSVILGYGFMRILMPHRQLLLYHWEDYCMCGLMLLTVYAQYYSIFAGVGAVADAGMLLLCLTLWILFGKKLAETLAVGRDASVLGRVLKGLGLLVLFLIMAYGASRGYFHYDSDLYHGQAIRWIEEYGLVKGLGNLHTRLGYNSSFFSLSALFSFSWLGKGSYHSLAGFFAFLISVKSMRILGSIRKGRLQLPDYARLAGLYYVINIYDEMVSPASDYPTMLCVVYAVICVLEALEGADPGKSTPDADALAYPALMSGYGLTLKLSAASLLLVLVLPAWILIREKRVRKLLVYLLLGVGIVFPYLYRNVILTGWLLYPSTTPDLFSVVWKVPEGTALFDAGYIKLLARNLTSGDDLAYGPAVWVPGWFSALGTTEKLLFAATVAAVAAIPIRFILSLIRKTLRQDLGILWLEITICITALTWFLTAPLVRYGIVYLLLMPLVVFGEMFCRWGDRRKSILPDRAVLVLTAAFLCYKAIALAGIIGQFAYVDAYRIPQDYGTYEMAEGEVDGQTVYYPTAGDRTGYDPFPSTPGIPENLHLLGEEIRDGFYISE